MYVPSRMKRRAPAPDEAPIIIMVVLFLVLVSDDSGDDDNVDDVGEGVAESEWCEVKVRVCADIDEDGVTKVVMVDVVKLIEG